MSQPGAALTEGRRSFAALRGLLVRFFPPDSLGIFIVGFLLCALAGIPFEDALTDRFRRGFGWVPPVPAALALAAVLYLVLRTHFFFDAGFKALVAAYVLTRLLYSGVFINQSRVPLWEFLRLPGPLPQFYADGPWKFFLIVYGGWALIVLRGFQSVRDNLLRSGAETGDIETVSCLSAAFQTGGILLLGWAITLCYTLLA